MDTPRRRSLARAEDMLVGGCPDFTINDVQQVAARLEHRRRDDRGPDLLRRAASRRRAGDRKPGQEGHLVMTVAKAVPISHYVVLEVRQRQARGKARRDRAYARRARRCGALHADPKNADKVARDRHDHGSRPRQISKATIKPLHRHRLLADQRRRARQEADRGRDRGPGQGSAASRTGKKPPTLRAAGRSIAFGTTPIAMTKRSLRRAGDEAGARHCGTVMRRSGLEPRRRHRGVGGGRAQHQRRVPGAAVGDARCGSGSSSLDGRFLRAVSRVRRRCSLTGMVLALVVGMPRGLLLARVQPCASRSSPTS